MKRIPRTEKEWQKFWREEEIFKTEENSSKPKFYCLDFFPYPSGVGLHVGHPRGYVATDIFSHFKRMNGFNVLHPMGWDAFGLPAENYAIKTGIHPGKAVEENVERFKEQLNSLGLSYDWSREINTTDPNYYKWTQWIFIKLFEKGLAYEETLPINFCPSCKTGLANEEVLEGLCERCDSPVEKKDIRQWVLKITDYGERLFNDLDYLDWPEPIKEMQRNWIGRSEGAEVHFSIGDEIIETFTTRPDTLFGATFLVLAPEHSFVKRVIKGEIEISNLKEVEEYVKEARKKTDLERTDLIKEKEGVELKGIKAVNPINGEEIPVWIADYVLGFYGKGAVMSVPAHDERDYQMAKKYNLEIRPVIESREIPFMGEGKMINSGDYSGIDSSLGGEKIIEELEKKKKGKRAVNYKLRDWIFSRQRYWGEPIPLIHCQKCGVVPLKEEDLPLTLPEVEKYEPLGTGESPLAGISSWVETDCPKCKGKGKRETNTMPQWAGSCWYYLAYLMKGVSEDMEFPISLYKKTFKKWLPVDLYVGGAEHAVLHLLYARFWHKVLYDIGVVEEKEPFKKLKNQGLIMGEGGVKMSKSKGNVISPDKVVKEHGPDVFRLFEMFVGRFEDEASWDEEGVVGMRRFLERVAQMEEKVEDLEASSSLESLLHKTIKKVTEDIESFKFNTAISSLMVFSNYLKEEEKIPREVFLNFLKLLSPFAPHFSEEMWSSLKEKPSILKESWPKYSLEKIKEEEVTLIIQVNGKMRGKIEVKKGEEKEKVEIKAREMVEKWLKGKEIKKVIYLPDKLINFVLNGNSN